DALARANLAKAQIETEQARSNYYQSLIPDPSKYKVAAPGAPKLNASAARRAFDEAASAAGKVVTGVVNKVRVKVTEGKGCVPNVYVLPGSAAVATRSLIATSLSTQQALEQLAFQIGSAIKDLEA